ncbi:18960_t:CDS:2, partial [Racocetra persica]
VSNIGKGAREKVQIKLNLEEILRKTQETKVMILLENTVSNKCYRANMGELISIKKSIKKELQNFEDKNRNKVPRIKLCFDTQHYFAAGAGRFIEDYKEVLDKYKKEIYLIHINNVMKERKINRPDGVYIIVRPTIFGSGQDIYTSLLNRQLPQEIFEMIMKHPNTKAAILETPEKTNKQKNEQVSERIPKAKLDEVYQQIQTIPLLSQDIRKIQDNEIL